MKKIFFLGMIALLCACQTNEPEPEPPTPEPIPESEYVELTYEELCAMWDADTTMANIIPDTLTTPAHEPFNGGYFMYPPPYEDSMVAWWLTSNKQITSKDGPYYLPFSHMVVRLYQPHCQTIPHNGYFSTTDGTAEELTLYYGQDGNVQEYGEHSPRYKTIACKLMIYDIVFNLAHRFSWRFLVGFYDIDGVPQYVYSEGVYSENIFVVD